MCCICNLKTDVLLQGPPGAAGAPGPRGVAGDAVGLENVQSKCPPEGAGIMCSSFQGLPGIIGPPGPAGQRGDKVGHMTKTHKGPSSQKHVLFGDGISQHAFS